MQKKSPEAALPTAAGKPRPGSENPGAAGARVDLCVLGAGPAGIALAASAASCGAKVVLIEKHRFGGTSANYGTMPSMTLSASADVAATVRSAAPFAVRPAEPDVDWHALSNRVREAVAGFAPNVAPERLAGLGVHVVQGTARFTDQKTVVVGEQRIEARRFVVATGSSPLVPAIPGLDQLPAFTTETIFENREPIEHLIVLGGGASGTTIAQSIRRLGARVTLIDQGRMLSRFDPELADVVRQRLLAEGVAIFENAVVDAVSGSPRRIAVTGKIEGAANRIEATHLLIACGRKPAVSDLGLDLAKVAVHTDGITVDRRLRTSNRRVFAIGDVTGHPHSVQKAEHQARSLVASLVVGRSLPGDPRIVPIGLYTDPEIAIAGLDEDAARRHHGRIEVHRFPVRENLKALAIRAPAGHLKVITSRSGKILGAAIAARSAAELIQVWALAISKNLTLPDMAGWIPPHPTLGELSRKAAVHRYAETAGLTAQRAWGRLLARLQ